MAGGLSVSRELVLGPFRYVVGCAPASEALIAGALVLNAVGPAIEGLGRAGVAGGAGGLLQNKDLGPVLLQLARVFAPYTQVVEGDKSYTLKDVFDLHFQGRMGALAQWLEVALELNLADFLDVISAKFREAKAKLLASSQSQTAASKTG